MKTELSDLAILGGTPAFGECLVVNRPNIGDREAFTRKVEEILDSHWFANNGPVVTEFEEKLATFLGVKHCVVTSSATMALQLCIKALDLHGEIIVPSFTFISTAHSVSWMGLKPVFCDIDPRTWNISPEACESLVSGKTSAILGVHLWGRACDTEKLESLAARHKLKLIFDAAHAFGCSHGGRMIGSFGDAEVLSFHATKSLHAFEGGAVATNSTSLAEKIRLIRNFGFTDYDTVVRLGTNGKMPEVSAAMGLSNLAAFHQTTGKSRIIYETYLDQLADINGIEQLSYDTDEKNNYHYVAIQVDESRLGISRNELLEILNKENIVARRYFYPGCHCMQPYASEQPEADNRLPVTNRISARILLLPAGAEIMPGEVTQICDLIRFIATHARDLRIVLNAETGSQA